MGLATEVESAIDVFLNGFIAAKSAALSTALVPVALSAITIYVMFMGFAVMRGETNDSVSTITWRIFNIAFITGIALSAGAYQTYVVDFVTGIQGAFISIFSGGGATIGTLIDNLAQPFDTLGSQLWSNATTDVLPNFALLFAAALCAIAELILFALGLGMYLLSKVALTLILAVGPVFIFLAMFPSTKRFTESWLGQALGFALTNSLIAISFTMFTSFVSQFASHMVGDIATTKTILTDMVSLLLVSGSLALVLWNVDTLASALAGGTTITGIGSAVARGIMNMSRGKSETPSTSVNEIKSTSSSNSKSTASTFGGKAPSSQWQAMYQKSVLDNFKK